MKLFLQPFQAYGYKQGAIGPKLGIIFRVEEDWIQTRRILTPALSSKKLKLVVVNLISFLVHQLTLLFCLQMAPIVEKSCIALCEKFQKVADSGKSGDIWRYMSTRVEVVCMIVYLYQL